MFVSPLNEQLHKECFTRKAFLKEGLGRRCELNKRAESLVGSHV